MYLNFVHLKKNYLLFLQTIDQESQFRTRGRFGLIKGTIYFSIGQYQCTVLELLLYIHTYIHIYIYIYKTKYFLENNKKITNFITVHMQIDMTINVIGNCELKT